MPVTISNTPNPNAIRFGVGVEVGGPRTFVAGGDADDPTAAALLAIDGVASVFMSSDFVTVSKLPDIAWEKIVPRAEDILAAAFPG